MSKNECGKVGCMCGNMNFVRENEGSGHEFMTLQVSDHLDISYVWFTNISEQN